jgi:hypothetical protein
MHDASFEGHVSKRSRPLVHALIISVALNLGLLATFITFIIKEKKIEILLQAKTASKRVGKRASLSQSNGAVLEEFEKLSFAELIQLLRNEEVLEQGYRKRDLALSCLVAYHHFDLQRALPGMEFQKRVFSYSKPEKNIELFPGLDEERFQVIHYFARVEVWPLTSEGLYEEMKHRRENIPPSLMEAFFLSKEFFAIERAFNRLPFVFKRETLLSLLLEGDWKLVERAAAETVSHPTGEIQNIGQFLSGFENSKLAGYLLVALDPDHPYLRFSDEKLESFIGLLDQQTAGVELFLNRIATSARSDHIRELAKARIQSWGKEVRVSSQEYVVQKGDSLWGVSRDFDVSMEKIREANQLQSDVLTPGQRLQIPHAQHN